MKKVLSVFIAVCVMLMTSVTTFAAEAPTLEKVEEQINGAVKYLTDSVASYGVDDALDFYIISENMEDIDKYADGFLNDVKANLDANGGKIVSSYGENLATYGAVISILIDLGEDPADFNGYNIETAFLAMDPTVEPASPSYYRAIVQGAFYCEADESIEFIEKVCDTYVEKYYTMGQGVDYYGYSCDNTAYFIETLSFAYLVSDKYDSVLEDAIQVLDTYKVDGGYCFNPQYGTQPNANSTALALMAHSAYISEDMEDLDEYFDLVNGIYADLCTFEGSGAGIFTYDDQDSKSATHDALMALSYYYIDVLMQQDFEDEDPTEEDTTAAEENNKTTTTTASAETTATAKTNTSKKSPSTGSETMAVSASIALLSAAGVFAVLKRKVK